MYSNGEFENQIVLGKIPYDLIRTHMVSYTLYVQAPLINLVRQMLLVNCSSQCYQYI